MVTYNAHEEIPQLENEAHQHAFVLVGKQQLFGVHMTQYHCELHKYQIILKLDLPDCVLEEYARLQSENPKDTFVLCNAKDHDPDHPDPEETRSYSIPDIGSGMVTEFTANIFQGIRPLSDAEIAADSHFFPWALKYAHPAIPEFTATITRIVTFRPFDHLATLPEYARYLIFGDHKAEEAHMTNLQTAELVTNAFEPQVFGPDYDHVMSLSEMPSWLKKQASMLESGIVVTTPIVRLVDPETGQPTIPNTPPFVEGNDIEVLYRGIGPARTVNAGVTYLYCTAVCNSPRLFAEKPDYDSYLDSLPKVEPMCHFSLMPKKFWNIPEIDG